MKMKVEIRNNSVHLEGYVNVHTRDSRVLMDTRGQFVEQIMPKAFEQSLRNRPNVALLFNHREDRQIGSTTDGKLKLYEDVIGLRAQAEITDPEVVEKAKRGDLRGWSFGFRAGEQRWDEQAQPVQRRYVETLDLFEVSILDVTPAYFATTVEARGEEMLLMEKRAGELEGVVVQEETREVEENNDDKNPEDDAKKSQEERALLEFEIEILKLKGC